MWIIISTFTILIFTGFIIFKKYQNKNTSEKNSVIELKRRLMKEKVKNSNLTKLKTVEPLVKISKSKYHKVDCHFIQNSSPTIPISLAKQKGLKACKRCDPDQIINDTNL